LLGSALSYVILAYAPNLTVVILSRILTGLMAGNVSIAFAYVADITDDSNRSAGLGKVSAALGLGFMTGPAIGGLLAGNNVENANYLLTALAAAGINFLAMLAAIVFLQESLDVKKRKPFEGFSKIITLATFSPAKSILPLVSCGLIFYAAMSMMESIFPLWANKIFSYGPSNIGGVFFMLGSLGVIIQGGLIGRLTKLLGEKKLVQLAALSAMTGLILIGSATFEFSLWIGLFFFGCGAATFNPSLSSLISKSADPSSRGQYLGHYQAACSMGRIVGPSFSGFLYSYFHESTPFYTGAIIAIPVLILIASFTLRKTPKIIK
jgi:DHA1 family tetracycline resistance protein-like MFS transporter